MPRYLIVGSHDVTKEAWDDYLMKCLSQRSKNRRRSFGYNFRHKDGGPKDATSPFNQGLWLSWWLSHGREECGSGSMHISVCEILQRKWKDYAVAVRELDEIVSLQFGSC